MSDKAKCDWCDERATHRWSTFTAPSGGMRCKRHADMLDVTLPGMKIRKLPDGRG